jgi:hypothetical protein
MTGRANIIAQSRSIEYIAVSLSLALNEQLAATATASAVVESASAAAQAASEALSSLYHADDLYGMTPSFGGNLAMSVVMGVFMICHALLGAWFRTWWFGISFVIGTALEMIGYIGRTISGHNPQSINPFLIQIICLTIAPCFIMAGIYYLLGQLIQIYGTEYALLKPMWYLYIFISCDIISLAVQAAGGGIAATSLTQYQSAKGGTHTMVGGLAFQVFSMSIFLWLLFNFLWRIKYLRKGHADMEFNPRYCRLREHKKFQFFPIIIVVAVMFVYVRSIYRVIELSEGWVGYLIVHEVYFMILDALMIGLTCVIFIPWHPGIILGGRIIAVEGTRAYKRQIKRESATKDSSTNDQTAEHENESCYT